MADTAFLFNFEEYGADNMQYKNAKDVLPEILLVQIQEYIKGKKGLYSKVRPIRYNYINDIL